jgi:hypothetical protein
MAAAKIGKPIFLFAKMDQLPFSSMRLLDLMFSRASQSSRGISFHP